MGINRWSDTEERKRQESDAKAGEQVPEETKGDASSRMESSREPTEDEEKRRVVENLEERESVDVSTSAFQPTSYRYLAG
jgi:hypothetical protein